MLKTMPDPQISDEDPSSTRPADQKAGNSDAQKHNEKNGFLSHIKSMFSKPKNGNDMLREALEEYIEEMDEETDTPSMASHEKALISNVLKLRDSTVIDVMIPRADIAAIEVNASQESLMELLSEKQFSRIPVYRDTLDDILGTVHIKDIMSSMAANQDLNIKSMIRPVPIVSPSLPVLDLLLKMQSDKKHMVLVVDEHGGIDGLVTIGDLIETIVGEFDDEFDTETPPQITENSDGSIVVDARLDIDDFEESYGQILSEDDHEEADTLGGLVFYTAGRIPARGEVIEHESGMVFEILDADQRRVSRLRIRNIPEKTTGSE